LLSEKEFVAKILAAKEARSNKNFIIIARVEALISGAGMKEAIKRANAYENAGADAILIHSKQKTPDEIFEFTDSWKGSVPIVVVPTTYDSVKISDLSSHNIKMVIYANQTLRVAHIAMTKLLQELVKADSISEVKDKISTMQDIFDLQDMYGINNQERELEEKLKKLGYIH
jgi:phosphoenolpyruvate phosphomutase